jgi:hypothetical protein
VPGTHVVGGEAEVKRKALPDRIPSEIDVTSKIEKVANLIWKGQSFRTGGDVYFCDRCDKTAKYYSAAKFHETKHASDAKKRSQRIHVRRRHLVGMKRKGHRKKSANNGAPSNGSSKEKSTRRGIPSKVVECAVLKNAATFASVQNTRTLRNRNKSIDACRNSAQRSTISDHHRTCLKRMRCNLDKFVHHDGVGFPPVVLSIIDISVRIK